MMVLLMLIMKLMKTIPQSVSHKDGKMTIKLLGLPHGETPTLFLEERPGVIMKRQVKPKLEPGDQMLWTLVMVGVMWTLVLVQASRRMLETSNRRIGTGYG